MFNMVWDNDWAQLIHIQILSDSLQKKMQQIKKLELRLI